MATRELNLHGVNSSDVRVIDSRTGTPIPFEVVAFDTLRVDESVAEFASVQEVVVPLSQRRSSQDGD